MSDTVSYISKLQVARDKIDKRIKIMGGKSKKLAVDTGKIERLEFEVVTKDSLFLSYFAEFLERDDRSHLLQVFNVFDLALG